jgi:hypothetical protein
MNIFHIFCKIIVQGLVCEVDLSLVPGKFDVYPAWFCFSSFKRGNYGINRVFKAVIAIALVNLFSGKSILK